MSEECKQGTEPQSQLYCLVFIQQMETKNKAIIELIWLEILTFNTTNYIYEVGNATNAWRFNQGIVLYCGRVPAANAPGCTAA